MNDQLPPEIEAKIAEAVMENKPHLIAIEDEIQRVAENSSPKGFGTIDFNLEIRGKEVTKIEFRSKSTWLKNSNKPKEI